MKNMKISKNITTIFSFAVVITILVLPFIFHTKSPQVSTPAQNTATTTAVTFNRLFVIGKQVLNVSVADTPEKREQGLSGTASLTDKQGMLFVFDSPNRPSFWMKDMNYSLDIIWIDENKKIVGVSENLDPSSYPHTFSPLMPVMYALEVPACSYKALSLRVGDSILY